MKPTINANGKQRWLALEPEEPTRMDDCSVPRPNEHGTGPVSGRYPTFACVDRVTADAARPRRSAVVGVSGSSKGWRRGRRS